MTHPGPTHTKAGRAIYISYAPHGVKNSRFVDIKRWAAERRIPVHDYRKLADAAVFCQMIKAEFCLVAGWYHMLPPSLRDIFIKGCAGLHASLLPKLRGGAPLNWAILNGEREAGMSLFVLGDGVDDGDLYGQERFLIDDHDGVDALVERSHLAARKLVSRCLPRIADGSLRPVPQQGEPSYGLQRSPADGQILWHHDALRIDRLVRAVTRPYPGARSSLEGREIRIWRCSLAPETPKIYGVPGQIAALRGFFSPFVVTGSGGLLIHEATFQDGSDALPILMTSNNKKMGGGHETPRGNPGQSGSGFRAVRPRRSCVPSRTCCGHAEQRTMLQLGNYAH